MCSDGGLPADVPADTRARTCSPGAQLSASVCKSPPQEALDPSYGGEELAALRKEVRRLGAAAGELARGQEGLVGALEAAVTKREVIGVKASSVGRERRVEGRTAGGRSGDDQAPVWAGSA